MTTSTEDISFLLPVRKFADKGIKWLLESADNVKGLLEIVAVDLVDRLDFSRLQVVNQSFIPDNLRQQESDVICLAPFSGEETGEVLIYLLIEHQSTPSHVMGFRLLFYMIQIWDVQRREWDPLREVIFQGLSERTQTKKVQQMSQTMAEYLMEQGEKRGEARGEARGQIKAKQEAVLEILRLRFDAVPVAMERRIKSIRRLDRLDGLLKQAVTADSISEVVMD